ncbi:hypothetical protein D6C77_00711 [Aureobasidium pullulans]|nr:hypothetical protein D6C77_00711 [Aureobasidium pullulans]
MAPSSVDQTTQSQSPLTTSEEIKSLYPKEKMEEYWTKTTELAKEYGFDEEAEHVQGVYQLFQAAAEDHSNKSLVHFFNGRLLRQRQKELDRHKKNIDEINEERRQLKIFEKHYLGRDD